MLSLNNFLWNMASCCTWHNHIDVWINNKTTAILRREIWIFQNKGVNQNTYYCGWVKPSPDWSSYQQLNAPRKCQISCLSWQEQLLLYNCTCIHLHGSISQQWFDVTWPLDPLHSNLLPQLPALSERSSLVD